MAMLKGSRVLVTGGAGFVGSHLVDALVGAGCGEIVVLDNLSGGTPDNLARSMLSGRVNLVVGDIRNGALLSELVAGIDTVFHQAAMAPSRCAADPHTAFEVMVKAPFELFEQARQADVKKIVMASSAMVYGAATTVPTSERQPCLSNRTLYGAAKRFGEALLRSFNEMYDTRYVALRYFDVYGPRLQATDQHMGILPSWMRQIECGEPPVIRGDGRRTVDLIHVQDVARANILAAVSPANDAILNIGSGAETSLLSLARLVARSMGRPDLEPMPWEAPDAALPPRRRADITAARATIGFEAIVPLADGLTGLVDWWRIERASCDQEGRL